jgi:hypothetical protein
VGLMPQADNAMAAEAAPLSFKKSRRERGRWVWGDRFIVYLFLQNFRLCLPITGTAVGEALSDDSLTNSRIYYNISSDDISKDDVWKMTCKDFCL